MAAAAVARIPGAELEVVDDSENAHVIAGDILSPNTNDKVLQRALKFVQVL